MPHIPLGSNTKNPIIKSPNIIRSISATDKGIADLMISLLSTTNFINPGRTAKNKLPNKGPVTVPTPPMIKIRTKVIE